MPKAKQKRSRGSGRGSGGGSIGVKARRQAKRAATRNTRDGAVRADMPQGANFGPEGRVELIDKSRLVICTSCGEIRGMWHVISGLRFTSWMGDPAKPYRQLCECERTAAPGRKPRGYKSWQRDDFDCIIELCRCCSLVAVSSGSKWSTFQCLECLRRTERFNASAGRCVIPIGRYSLMNRVALVPDKPSSIEKVESFLDACKGLWAMADRLGEWRAMCVRKNIEQLGLGSEPEIPLLDYLALNGGQREFKANCFAALLEWLGHGTAGGHGDA